MADTAKTDIKVAPSTVAETPRPEPVGAEAQAAPAKAVAAKPVNAASTAKPEAARTAAAQVKSPAAKASPTAPATKKIAKTTVKKPAFAKAAKSAAPKKTVAKITPKPRASAPASAPRNETKVRLFAMNMNDTMKTQTETVLNQGKVAVEQMQSKARDAIDQSVKTMEEMNSFARGNVEAMVEAGKVAAKHFETITQSAIELARKNAEAATTAARSLSAAKNANEFMQMQNDFARTQFDKLVADGSKMTELLVKMTGEMFEPISNRMAIAADKVAKAGAR